MALRPLEQLHVRVARSTIDMRGFVPRITRRHYDLLLICSFKILPDSDICVLPPAPIGFTPAEEWKCRCFVQAPRTTGVLRLKRPRLPPAAFSMLNFVRLVYRRGSGGESRRGGSTFTTDPACSGLR